MDNQALYHAMGQTLQNSMGHMPVGGAQALAAPPVAQVPAMATQPAIAPIAPPMTQLPIQQAPVVAQMPVPQPQRSFLHSQTPYHGGLI